MSKGKIFCAYPYVSLFVANSGKQHPCCYAQNAHVSEVRAPSIAKVDSVEELWNSEYLKKIRELMSAGQFPAACSVCERTEAFKQESHRERSLQQFSEELDSVQVSEEHEVSSPIRHLDLRLGNKCNLACRMCHPASSNQLIPEWLESDRAEDREEALDALATKPWSRTEKSIEILQSEIVQPSYLHLAGGEPAIDKRHERVLEHLVANGMSKAMTVSYNTNLSQLIPALKFKNQFKKIIVTASIDGVGAMNSYIRYPSVWSDIEKNLFLYLDLQSTTPHLQVEVNVTLSAYNILHVSEIVNYFAKLPYDKKIVPVFTIVLDPEWLDFSVLPAELLSLAQRRLGEAAHTYSDEGDQALITNRLQVVAEAVRHTRHNNAKHLRFCERTEFYDRKRKQSLFDVSPEWSAHWRRAPVLMNSL